MAGRGQAALHQCQGAYPAGALWTSQRVPHPSRGTRPKIRRRRLGERVRHERTERTVWPQEYAAADEPAMETVEAHSRSPLALVERQLISCLQMTLQRLGFPE